MEESVFVDRQRELEQLLSLLDRAGQGQTQVCFVAGEPGAGKTALVREFARRADQAEGDPVVALSQCDPQIGVSDPYAPFRDVLSLLLGQGQQAIGPADRPSRTAQRWRKALSISREVLLTVGPDVAGLLLPGSTLLARAASVAANKSGLLEIVDKKVPDIHAKSPSMEQAEIFRQYTQVIKTLAERLPLVLIVEDLHWADNASIGLLFHLARQLQDSRLLLVGTYRTTDVAMGREGERHPLEPVLNELKRYRGEVMLDLDLAREAERRAFSDALVDAEPNRLGREFRQALFARAHGQPLFTAELLRTMQERGHLVKDAAGYWVVGGNLDWDVLPTRVEGVIEERIARIAEHLREILTIGSVEGVEFTAQVISRVQQVHERQLLRDLSRELQQRHRLLREMGERKVGQKVLSPYHFEHALFQHYVYGEISAGERRLLHQQVAEALEDLYQGQTEAIAVQLARHYTAAEDDPKAAHYHVQAGDQASAKSAYREAIASYEAALARMPQSPAARAAFPDRARTLLSLGRAYYMISRFEQAEDRYQAALALAQSVQDHKLVATILTRLVIVVRAKGDNSRALQLGQEAVAAGRTAGDPQTLAQALRILGTVASRLGDYAGADAYFQESLALYRSMGDARGVAALLVDRASHRTRLEDYAAARQDLEEGARAARDIAAARSTLLVALNNLGYVATQQGDAEPAMRYFGEALTIAREIDDRLVYASALNNLGDLKGRQGDEPGAGRCFREALSEALTIGSTPLALEILVNIAEWRRRAGQVDRAAELLGLVLDHPAGFHHLRDQAARVLERLRGAMPADELEAALKRGQSMTPEDAAQQMASGSLP